MVNLSDIKARIADGLEINVGDARAMVEEIEATKAALADAHGLLAELRNGMQYEYGWGSYIKAIDKLLSKEEL